MAAGTFADGDLVQISGASNNANNGIFSVKALSGAGPFDIEMYGGSGNLPSSAVDFVQTEMISESGSTASVHLVNLSVLRTDSDGLKWTTSVGSTSTDFATVSEIATVPPGTGFVVSGGAPGGQTINGGTVSSEDLSLFSNLSKDGQIILDGTSAPSATNETDGAIKIIGDAGFSSDIYVALALKCNTIEPKAPGSNMTIGESNIVINVDGHIKKGQVEFFDVANDTATTIDYTNINNVKEYNTATLSAPTTWLLPNPITESTHISIVKTGGSTLTIDAGAGKLIGEPGTQTVVLPAMPNIVSISLSYFPSLGKWLTI